NYQRNDWAPRHPRRRRKGWVGAQASASGGGVGTSSAGSGGGEVTRARAGAGPGRSMVASTTTGSAICCATPRATAAGPHVSRTGLPDSASRRCVQIGQAHFSSPVRCAQQHEAGVSAVSSGSRSEERRVGKECRAGGGADEGKEQ